MALTHPRLREDVTRARRHPSAPSAEPRRGEGGAPGRAPAAAPPLPPVRGSGGAASPASEFRAPGARPAPRRPPPPPQPGAMATAAGDGAVKPLQCAMKLANGAIELDTGNQPRVRRGEAGAPGGPPPAAGPAGVGEGGAAEVGAVRTLRRSPGLWTGVSACDLGQLPALPCSVFPSVQRVGNWIRGFICNGDSRGSVKQPSKIYLANNSMLYVYFSGHTL